MCALLYKLIGLKASRRLYLASISVVVPVMVHLKPHNANNAEVFFVFSSAKPSAKGDDFPKIILYNDEKSIDYRNLAEVFIGI